MPKYTIKEAKLRAKRVAKCLLRNGLNQSAAARELGISKQGMQNRIKHTPVKDALQEYIDSPKLKSELIKVAREALKAKTYTKKGSKPDHDARHKFWHDLVVASGALKSDGASVGIQIFCGSEIISNLKQIEGSQTRSLANND